LRISVLGKAGFSPRQLLAITIITSGTLAWLFVIDYYFESLFQSSVNSQFWLAIGKTMFYGFGAFSAIVGVFLSSKVSRRKLLGLWTILGVITTGAIVAVQGLLFVLILSALLGISLGLGFPCSMALLADSTKAGQRGRASGLLMLETFMMVFLVILADTLIGLGLIEIVLVCITLRLTGFMGLSLDRCEKQRGKEKSWFSVLTQRDFAFYMFPWMMFNVASGLTGFVWLGLRASSDFDVAFQIGNTLQFAGTAIVCMISGFIADRFGRKPPIYIGVILFSVSYAILGIATNETSVIIHLTTLGIAWGFLMVVYLTIPGDLANVHAQEKYYALATVLPLVVYSGLNALPKALGIPAPANILSPILSVILFLSLVPVLYASETLPDTEIRKRKLREHVEKVGKLVAESKKNE
jgi:MFS family permease